jgi:hypothetical protein
MCGNSICQDRLQVRTGLPGPRQAVH